MRWGTLVVAAAVASAVGGPPVTAQEVPSPPDPSDALVGAIRQVCELQWIDGVCEITGYPDPQYRSDGEPNPDEPLAWRIGVVHQHSGYSDGDPDSRPADYFRASREGHNEAGDGRDTGVRVDFVLSSEHSENEKLPITTSADCIDPSGIPDALAELDLAGIVPPLACSHVEHADHYRKWNETLVQAVEATDFSPPEGYTGFTGMRGFEWTNDYFNHLGVYFSRNVVNAKVDGSYVAMEVFWDWLRRPAEQGGGRDALVVFNHPGGLPKLTPFDGGLPHNELLQVTLGGANWNDLAHVPDVDDRVVGIEVNGGRHLAWYVKALANGWHLGPVAAEDEHGREWSSAEDGKTLVLTRGRSPGDYYVAFQQHRTIALQADLVGGSPGRPATHPTIDYYANGSGIDDPGATVLGSAVSGPGPHALHLAAAGLPPGSPAVLVGRGDEVRPLGSAGGDGSLAATAEVATPAQGEDWWFALVCPPGTTDCGTGEAISAVTAPIWVPAATASPGRSSPAADPGPDPSGAVEAGAAPADASAGGTPAGGGQSVAGERLPTTGPPGGTGVVVVLALAGLATVALRRTLARSAPGR